MVKRCIVTLPSGERKRGVAVREIRSNRGRDGAEVIGYEVALDDMGKKTVLLSEDCVEFTD